jgi:hypothetical protein
VEPAIPSPLLIRQKPDRHKDFLLRGVAKVLTFAALPETRVLLEILVCKTLVQEFILLQRLLVRQAKPGKGEWNHT